MKPQKNLIYLGVIVIVVVLVVWAGIKILKPSSTTADTSSPNSQTGPGNKRGQWGQGGERGNFKPLHGTITSIDANSGTIVMKADDGSTKNITTDSTTRISEMSNDTRQTLAISDLTSGEEINVMASDTSAATITPRMIIVGAFTPPQRPSGSYGNGENQDSGGIPPDGAPGSSI